MMRSLFAGVSGLKVHQTRMDSIGNNIANINTTGFKSSRTTFSDMLSQTQAGAGTPTTSLGGTNPRQIGLGVNVASIDIIFTDSSAQSTGKNTDVALSGNALFVIQSGDERYYTRDGAFEFDAEGNYVLPGTGFYVQGWNAIDGALNTNAEPENIVVPSGKTMNATATNRITFSGNLDSGDPIISTISYTNEDGDTITLDPNKSYTLLAGEIENVLNITKDTWESIVEIIEPGIISSTNGTISIPNEVWEDYNLEELSALSDDQVLAKITEFITDLNATYLRNRTNADGAAVTLSNTSMISTKKLTTDYSAASGGNADVKVAMANTIDDLNEIFGNLELIQLELSNSTGTIIPTGKVTVKSVHSDDVANGEDALNLYYTMGYDRLDTSGTVSGAIVTSYGTVDTSTSLRNAKNIMSSLITDINKMIRSISLMPVDTDTNPLDSSKIYLNLTATDTGAADVLATIRSLQFATDGSDLYEKYQQFSQLTDDLYLLHYSLYDANQPTNPSWADASPATVLIGATGGLRQPIDIYNYIKAKAYYMTAVDTEATTSGSTQETTTTAVNSDVYDPFFATIDDYNDSGATVASVDDSYRQQHNSYSYDSNDELSSIGYCNIIASKYNDLANAIDASDSSTKANYDRYYENARALYNHLQAKAYNSAFATDGSDLLVVGSDDYNDLLELVPGDADQGANPQASFVEEYLYTAALTDYYHARLVQAATEFNSIIVGKDLTVSGDDGVDVALDEDTIATYYSNDVYDFVTASSAYLTLSDGTRRTVTTGTYHVGDSVPLTTVITVYDSEGGSHKVPILLEKTDANTWMASLANARKDFTDQDDSNSLKIAEITEDDGSITTITMRPITIVFNGDGTYSSGSSDIQLQYSGMNGADTTQATVDFSSLTQFDGNSTAYPSADGNKAGVLTSVAIDGNGIITGTYTNGLRQQEAQIAVAQFINTAGLTKTGNTYWQESNNSGAPNIKTAPDLGIGITPSALEMSNVDLANEFSEMIITQRGFQANSKIINVGDEMLETLVNMKR